MKTEKMAGFQWRHGDWLVTLTRGPYKEDPAVPGKRIPISRYRITRASPGGSTAVEIPSGFSEHGCDSCSAGNVTLHSSADGSTLLIREVIPNDCSPCSNYVLVKRGSAGLDVSWLEIPDGAVVGLYECGAKVVAIDNDAVWYTYGDGKPKKARFVDLPKAHGPTLPG